MKTALPITGKAAPIHLWRLEFSSTLPIPTALSSWQQGTVCLTGLHFDSSWV